MDWPAGFLREANFTVSAMHGDMPQKERDSIMEVGIYIYLYYSAYGVHIMYSYHSLLYYYCILHMYIICLLMTHVYRCGAAVSTCSRCHWSSTTTSTPTESCTYNASAGRVASGARAWPSTSSRTTMCAR